MNLKYKNKVYSSDDIPIFLYFKNLNHKREFVDVVAKYMDIGEFVLVSGIDVALAGGTVIKDKRSQLYICIESVEEKKSLLKYIHSADEKSNAIISTPADIGKDVLESWIENHSDSLK